MCTRSSRSHARMRNGMRQDASPLPPPPPPRYTTGCGTDITWIMHGTFKRHASKRRCVCAPGKMLAGKRGTEGGYSESLLLTGTRLPVTIQPPCSAFVDLPHHFLPRSNRPPLPPPPSPPLQTVESTNSATERFRDLASLIESFVHTSRTGINSAATNPENWL